MHHENSSPRPASADAEWIARAQQGDESAFRSHLQSAPEARLSPLPAHDRQCPGSRRSDPGGLSAGVSKDSDLPRRGRHFQLGCTVSLSTSCSCAVAGKHVEISMETSVQNDKSESQRWEFAVPDLVLSGVIDRLSLELEVAELPEGYREVFLMHDVLGYGITKSPRRRATPSAIPNRSCTSPHEAAPVLPLGEAPAGVRRAGCR